MLMFSSSRYSLNLFPGIRQHSQGFLVGLLRGFSRVQAARTGKQPGKCGEREFSHTGYFGESREQGSALGAVQVAGTEMTLGGSCVTVLPARAFKKRNGFVVAKNLPLDRYHMMCKLQIF